MSDDLPTPPEKVGPYRIESRLGIGGMGAVYRAYDQRLERPVAIKQVLPESAEDPKARDRLRREARAVASLNHPAIVQIFDIVERDDGDWIVMELVEGQTLHRLVERGRLELGQGLFLGREIAEGLAEAHSKGVVHRDLKTENVMVTLSGHAKILDFGLAKRMWKGRGEASLSVQGAILGTGRAMSPEQAMGDPIDHRSDLFSLGTLLYETVTGKPPFMGSSIFHTLAQVCSDRQTSAIEVNDEIPRELSDLIDRMLEKNPARRPASAGAVADQLAVIARGLSAEQGGAFLPSRSSSPMPTATTGTEGSETLDREPPSQTRQISAIGVRPEPPSNPQRSVTRMDSSSGIFIKTLLHSSLVDRPALASKYSDSKVYEALGRHDRTARDLLVSCDGLEIDKSDGFLLLFDRPLDAVRYALAYQDRLADLTHETGVELSARVGIHLGEVFLRENTRQDVTRGAKPLEVEGLSRSVVGRLAELARPGQVLLGQEAYELARRAMPEDGIEGRPVSWASHGSFDFEGLEDGVAVYQVGPAATSDFRPPETAPRRVESPGGGRGWITLAAAAGLIVALAGAWLWWQPVEEGGPGDPRQRSAEAESSRRTVAVLGFRNQTRDPQVDWLSTAFAEMLRSELGAGGELRLVTGEGVAQLEREMDLPSTDSLSLPTLQKIRSFLGNDYVVVGTYTSLGGEGGRTLRVDVTLQDTRSGEALARLDVLDQEQEVFQMVSSLGTQLRQHLSIEQLTVDQAAEVRATTADSEVYRLYVEGLDHLRNFNALEARKVLEQAVAAEPEFALAHTALSRALLALGFDQEAEESARRAFDNVVDLPREHQLEIKARYRQVSGEWEDAIATYSELLEEFPSIEHGLQLANAQIVAGRRQQAEATLDALAKSDLSEGDRPRLELLRSEAAYSALDYQGALVAAQRAKEQGRELGMSLLVAEALRVEGTAMMQLGRYGEAVDVLELARERFAKVGDRSNLADVMDTMGIIEVYRTNVDQAEVLHRQALEILREIGSRKMVATVQNNLSMLYQGRGELEASRQLIEEAHQTAIELGDRSIENRYLDTMAWIALNRGALDEARRFATTLLAAYEKLGSPEGRAWGHFYLSQVLFLEGDPEACRGQLLKGLALAPEGDSYLLGFLHHAAVEVELGRGDPEAVATHLEAAWHHRTTWGEPANLAETRLLRARVRLAQGKAEEAEQDARRSAGELARSQAHDLEARAWVVVAEALWQQGRPREAWQALAPALERSEVSQSPMTRMEIELVAARLLAALGRSDEARRRMTPVIEEARVSGLGLYALEARAVAAEIEAWAETPGAVDRLRTLAEEVRGKGFIELARRLDTLL